MTGIECEAGQLDTADVQVKTTPSYLVYTIKNFTIKTAYKKTFKMLGWSKQM